MTTPDTAAVRAWARENGYAVSDRGRLPAEVTNAYSAANSRKKAAPAKSAKAAATTKPVKNGAAAQAATARGAATPVADPVVPAKASAPAKAPAPAKSAAPNKAPAPAKAVPVTEVADAPRPMPSIGGDERRLVALGEEIKVLTQRVAALEQAAAGKPGTGRATRFRRRS